MAALVTFLTVSGLLQSDEVLDHKIDRMEMDCFKPDDRDIWVRIDRHRDAILRKERAVQAGKRIHRNRNRNEESANSTKDVWVATKKSAFELGDREKKLEDAKEALHQAGM